MMTDTKFKPTPSSVTAAIARPTLPGGTRVYAIGDIHGRLDLLDALLEQIRLDANAMDAPKRLVLVLLGDLIDRGPDSQGVVQRTLDLAYHQILDGFEVHALMGNHEHAMLQFLAGDGDGAIWLANGGRETLMSYGIAVKQGGKPVNSERLRRALLDALPLAHRRLLRGLSLSHVEGGYAFVHAGIRPGVPWEAQSVEDLLWIRRDFTDSDQNFGCFVVHGHSARDTPDVRANRANIDTRAWSSGVLTCLVLQDDTQRFLST
ncbi:MAG TPA: metallophosphoesterase family protein [Magnetovibrio sp.]